MTARTFKMRLKKAIGEANYNMLDVRVKDSKVNMRVEGGYGHIINKQNNLCIYVDLRPALVSNLRNKFMIRYADSPNDWSSNNLGMIGRNQWFTEPDLYKAVWHLLNDMTRKGIW